MPDPEQSSGKNPFEITYSWRGLTACQHCDQLHQLPALSGPLKASCARCGSTLLRHLPHAVDRFLALNLTALVLLIITNSFPLLSMEIGERVQQITLFSASQALFDAGHWPLALLVISTSLIFPLLINLGWLSILLPLRFGHHSASMAQRYRWIDHLSPWSLIGVFMLGVLIAIFKLLDLASIVPGIALLALGLLLITGTLERLSQSPHLIWPAIGPPLIDPPADPPLDKASRQTDNPSALQQGWHSCHHCRLLVAADQATCPRCGATLHARLPNSFNRTLAFSIAAAILFIPANVYPIMTVIWLGAGEPSTILGGVNALFDKGMYPLALVVLIASIIVPAFKLLVLCYLLISVRLNSMRRRVDKTRLYRMIELVGAWSMVDVYLVAILTAVVQMEAIATVQPGLGASFFAGVVILTMLAAHSFDPRLIWDSSTQDEK